MHCDHCQVEIQQKTKRGEPKRFCSDEHRIAFHSQARRVGGQVLLKKSQPSRPRGMVDLSKIPMAERPNLLADIARRLGIEEGPTLMAARMARNNHGEKTI